MLGRHEEDQNLEAFNPILSFFNLHYFVVARPQVPCYFIFGDSGVDNGNNLGLKSTGKADFPPYGIDLPSGVPTGRFTNGRTATDLLGTFSRSSILIASKHST